MGGSHIRERGKNLLLSEHSRFSMTISGHHTRPVARFQYLVGHNTFLGGQDFCFYYMFKTNVSGRNKILGGTKKIGGTLLPNAPVAMGLHHTKMDIFVG